MPFVLVSATPLATMDVIEEIVITGAVERMKKTLKMA